MVYRLRRQPFCFSAGGAHAQQRHKGRLGVRGVLASRLPELIGGGRRIEHIVRDLKSEANCFSVRAQPSRVFWRAICTQSPDDAGGGDQRAGLAAMHLLERGHRQRLRFGLEIERLAADHPAGARRPEQRSEEHTSELQSRLHLVCRLLLEKKKTEIHRQLRARTQRIDTNTMYILLLRSVLLGFSCLPARWYLFFFF